MMRRIALLGQGQRILIFFLLMVGGLMFIATITVFLILSSVNAVPRVQAVAVDEGVSVSEFAILPDDDAYPVTVAADSRGTLYTASYATGTIWALDTTTPDASPQELPNTREVFGSVTALAVAADQSLYVLDRIEHDPRAAGGVIWRWRADAEPVEFARIEDETGFVAPTSLAVDAAGRVYVVDRGRREVWRWNADGSGGALFWTPLDAEQLPTGIAYDALRDALIITDSDMNTIYRVSVEGGAGQQLYRYASMIDKPSFYGVAVAPDGEIYVTALEQNGVARLDDDAIHYVAVQFRGPSDLVFAPDGKLYVTNFDSSALVVPGVNPRLPFALDVVTFTAD